MGHLKRLSVPDFWPILKKERKWAISPSAGPHPKEYCIPLAYIVREIFGYATNMREVKYIVKKGWIKRDKKIIKDYKFPVGLMDVIEFVKDPVGYRILPYKGYPLVCAKIPLNETSLKICKVINKTAVKKNKIQLNLHDGRNCLLDQSEAKNIKTFDSLLIELPNQRIKNVIKFEEEAFCLIIKGNNVGEYGILRKIHYIIPKRNSIVEIEKDNGNLLRTNINSIMCVGYKKPLIKMIQNDNDIVKPAVYVKK